MPSFGKDYKPLYWYRWDEGEMRRLRSATLVVGQAVPTSHTARIHRYEQAEPVTTQIGSLPFTDVDRAVAYSLEHDIPFLPELTALGNATLVDVRGRGS